jgi:hypothetical protein
MMSAEIGAPAIGIIQVKDDEDVVFTPGGKDVVRWWLVQLRVGGQWETRVFDGAMRRAPLGSLLRNPFVAPELIAVTAIDRVGNAAAPVVLRLQ